MRETKYVYIPPMVANDSNLARCPHHPTYRANIENKDDVCIDTWTK